MATVTKKFSLQSAHFLPGYIGKCANMHGHQWDIAITIEGPIDFVTGMVIDFSQLKILVTETIKDIYDHRVINECPPFSTSMELDRPTAENMGIVVLGITKEALKDIPEIRVHSVTIWETPDNWATVYPEDCREKCL